MAFLLSFDKRHKYDSLDSGITIEATLRHGEAYVACNAKVDPGAHVCLFAREIGEDLEFDVESGVPIMLGNFASGIAIKAYGHEVTLETLGLTFQTTVYFAEISNLPCNLLGRLGWLQLVRLAIIDYDDELYVSSYNE